MRIQDRLSKMKNKRGFTLVELMIVVAIIGVLAALAIYGVRKYLTNAKSAEARTALGRIAKDAQAAWERENMDGTTLAPGGAVAVTRALCPEAEPVPAAPPAGKYMSRPADWNAAGWSCLKFTMDGPQYFQYDYNVDGNEGVAGETFAAVADGTGNALGGFQMTGGIFLADGELVVTISPTVIEGLPGAEAPAADAPPEEP
jgi:type IV pilus assembly protein PilA